MLIPDRGHFPAGACRFAAASPCTPPHFPSTRISLNEASTKGSRVFARPIFPRLWPPGWNRPPLGFPRASHPADQEPDSARQGRDRPSSTDLELLAQLTSVDLQSGSSLNACDLASHVAKHSFAAGPGWPLLGRHQCARRPAGAAAEKESSGAPMRTGIAQAAVEHLAVGVAAPVPAQEMRVDPGAQGCCDSSKGTPPVVT